MPTFDSDGVSIHYEIFGEGRPIVLVHGFTANLRGNWVLASWTDTLTPIRQVVALDCRGHGESGKPHEPEQYGMDRMGGDVLRLMDHLGIERADLFGYSMGGRISLHLLMHHQERFDRVVLGGVGGGFTRGRSNIAEALLADDPSTITDETGKAFRLFAELNKRNDLQALAACMQAPRGTADPSRLAAISTPVLIVKGERDTVVGSADELAAAIPGARVLLIPDRDHVSVVPDQRFKEGVVQFLKEAAET